MNPVCLSSGLIYLWVRIIIGKWLYYAIIWSRWEVKQKFAVTGDSFLPCDRDFALIEKYKKGSKLLITDNVKI